MDCIRVTKTAASGSALNEKKQLGPDSHWEKQLDPDPKKMNADLQPCSAVYPLNLVAFLTNHKTGFTLGGWQSKKSVAVWRRIGSMENKSAVHFSGLQQQYMRKNHAFSVTQFRKTWKLPFVSVLVLSLIPPAQPEDGLQHLQPGQAGHTFRGTPGPEAGG